MHEKPRRQLNMFYDLILGEKKPTLLYEHVFTKKNIKRKF